MTDARSTPTAPSTWTFTSSNSSQRWARTTERPGLDAYAHLASSSFGAAITAFRGLAFFLLLWLLFRSTVMVGTGQIAVMTRFGKVTGQEVGEGFHLINPLDTPNKYDVKVQKTEAKAAAASKDLQDVQSTLVLNFALAPGEVSEIHQRVGHNYHEKLVDPAIQEVFKAATARFDATRLITERSEVKNQAVALLRDRLDDFGIRVVDLSVTNFSFSPEFTSAIEDKQVAQQEAERARFRLEAARTDAEAQRVQGQTLTRPFLQKIFLDKWDGHLPRVMAGNDDLSFLLDLQEAEQ